MDALNDARIVAREQATRAAATLNHSMVWAANWGQCVRCTAEVFLGAGSSFRPHGTALAHPCPFTGHEDDADRSGRLCDACGAAIRDPFMPPEKPERCGGCEDDVERARRLV